MHAGAELLAGVPNADGALDRLRAVERRTGRVRVVGRILPGARRGSGVGGDDPVDRPGVRSLLETRTRAIADVTTTQVAGILPPTWLTDIVDYIGTARPFIETFSRAPLPGLGNVDFVPDRDRQAARRQTNDRENRDPVAGRRTSLPVPRRSRPTAAARTCPCK